MLGIPLLEDKKGWRFLDVRCLIFVYWFQKPFMFPKDIVSSHQIPISNLLVDLDLISKILEICFNGFALTFGARLFEN